MLKTQRKVPEASEGLPRNRLETWKKKEGGMSREMLGSVPGCRNSDLRGFDAVWRLIAPYKLILYATGE
jgi:hypothetical protein